ncbi:MAG: flagellar biosynthetic protein FliP, partial [Christensenellaceae bacterium]|nr:flagellar biosynthetic protein FliP [Christensenellaceae bacterium]
MLMGLALVLLLAGCSLLPERNEDSDSPLGGLLGDHSQTVDIVLLLTILSVLPSILIMFPCFPRIIIVLALIRNGLGLQQMPPNQVLIGLA